MEQIFSFARHFIKITHLGDLFHELMTVLLYDELLKFLDTGEGSVEPQAVADRLNRLKKSYKFAGCHSGPTKVQFSLSLMEGKWD